MKATLLGIASGSLFYLGKGLQKITSMQSFDTSEEASISAKIFENKLPSSPEQLEKKLSLLDTNSDKAPDLNHIMLPIDAITDTDSVDGIKISLNTHPTSKFQLGSTWNYTNRTPLSLSLFSVYYPNSPLQNNKNYIAAKYNTENSSLDIKSHHTLYQSSNSLSPSQSEEQSSQNRGKNIDLKVNCNFPNEDVSRSSVGVQLIQESVDKTGGSYVRIGCTDGIYNIGFMDTLVRNVVLGFDAFYSSFDRSSFYSVGFRGVRDNFSVCARYVTNDDAPLSVGCLYQHNDKLAFMTKYKGAVLGAKKSDTGVRLRFEGAQLLGNISTSLKMKSSIGHIIDNFILLSLHGDVDFKKKSPNTTFGISVNLGGI